VSKQKYAAETNVPVDRSRSEIERSLQRFGADQFVTGYDADHAMIGFRARGRMIRFVLPIPDGRGRTKVQHEQAIRSAWRALALSIKAKVVAVESKIVTFEQEFMAQTVMPDGKTAAEHVLPRIADAYKTRVAVSLLPHFGGGDQQ
jgi:hypothetical protein